MKWLHLQTGIQKTWKGRNGTMLIVRADGNEKIGVGHIMRCLSVADAVKEAGETVCFITADQAMHSLIRQRGYEAEALLTDYTKMEEEVSVLLEKVKAIRKRHKKDTEQTVLLIDSYYATQAYLSNVKQEKVITKLAVMDDLFLYRNYVTADVIINYNMYGEQYPEPRKKDCCYLLGPAYAPLRKQFLQLPYEKPNQGKCELQNLRKHGQDAKTNAFLESGGFSILLLTGGADPCHIAKEMTEYFLSKKTEWNFFLHVVCGQMNPDREELLLLEKKYLRFLKIHTNVTDMASLMRSCDAAMTAAGSTVYELCALKIPFAVYYFVDNQEKNAKACELLAKIKNAGDYRMEKETVKQRLYSEMQTLCREPQYYEKLSQSVGEIVDGRGAERIAAALL